MHDDVLRSHYDAERQAYLESQGIRVLCFDNRALLELSEYVVDLLNLRILNHHPVCGVKVAIAIFLTAAATPPGQEG